MVVSLGRDMETDQPQAVLLFRAGRMGKKHVTNDGSVWEKTSFTQSLEEGPSWLE